MAVETMEMPAGLVEKTGEAKARLLVLDVETYRTRNAAVVERISAEALAKRPAQNVRKELKVEWDTEAARAERVREAVDKTAVDVLLAELLCVGFLPVGGRRKRPVAVYSAMVKGMDPEKAERGNLRDLVDTLDAVTDTNTVWVGHNILKFDLPVILNRLRRYRMAPPKHFPEFVGGRWRGRVFDTMTRTPCQNGIGFVSMAAVCEAYGLPAAKSVDWRGAPMDGSRVGEAYEAGEYQLLHDYQEADVVATLGLYNAMTGGDTYGTYDRPDSVGAAVSEIEASDLTESQKALAVYRLLDVAGLVPRCAA